jgi:hypothetical protein
LREHAGLEDFLDFAHRAVEVEFRAVAGDDAGGFLPAMLQGVETEIGEIGSFGMSEDTEYTTLVMKVIVENVLPAHEALRLCRLNSNHVGGKIAQTKIAAIGSTIVKS